MNKKIKICFLNHDLNNRTGVGRFGISYLAALKKLVPDLEYQVLTHDNFLPTNKLKLILAIPKIRNIFKKYDIIHALDGYPYGVVAAIAAVGLKKKLIITLVGTGAVHPLYRIFKRWLVVWAYKKANRLVAISNNTKKEILEIVHGLKIDIIKHGVDFARYNIVSSSYQKEIKQLGPYILSVGSLKKRKGFQCSIEAFAEVAKKFPKLKYIIVGDGREKQNLEFGIKNLGLKDRVMFLRNLHHDFLVSLYQNAELFILLPQDDNKDIEGFGLVFLEAAASGLPVVTTTNSGAEDAILDGKNGILVPPRNFKKAAEAIVKILSSPELKEFLSIESVNFAKSMTWEKVAREYKTLYEN